LVGRAEELAVLEDALSELVSGRCACVAIGGEPGIGKTRLAQEAADIAERHGCWVMSGRATELEQDVPFAVAISALDPALGSFAGPVLKGTAPELVTELGAVFPALASRVGGGPPGLQAERYRLHHAIGALITELAAQRPVVLVLDDLHWADAASLELVAHLLRHPPAGPVLLLLAYRSNQAPAELLVALAAAAREGSLTQVELGVLGESDAEELLGDIDASSRAAIYRESGGNPFYLEELARAHRGGSRASGRRTDDVGQPGVPVGVRLVIEQEELARLSEHARSVLRAASVVGDPFDPAIVAAVTEVSESEALAGLDEAAALELVQPTQLARMLRFRHPIVRRTVYESGGPAWRIGAHARAANVLAEQGAPVTSRAPHVQRSARPGNEAAIALLTAAAHDVAPRAPAVAARWFEAALDLLPADSSAERQLELLTPMAASLTAAGRTAQSREVLGRVLALLPDGELELRAKVVVMVARVDQMLGRHGRARQLIERALCDSQDSASTCVLLLAVGIDHWHARKPELLRSSALAALQQAQIANRPQLVAEAVAQVALAACEQGATGDAVTRLQEAQRLVESLTDEQLAQRIEGINVVGHVATKLGRFDHARELFERALQIARASGQDWWLVPLTVGKAIVNVRLGRLDEALADSDGARDAAHLLHDPLLCLWSEMVACGAALARGELRIALAAGASATALAQDSSNVLLGASSHLLFAAAQLQSGEPAQARQRILEHAGGPDLPLAEALKRPLWYCMLAGAELVLGRRDVAEEWTLRAEASAQTLALPFTTAQAELARATLLLADGDANQASGLALRAAEGLRSIGAVVDAALSDMLAGRALALAGRRQDAIEHLQHAYAVFAGCGAKSYRDEAARELRRIGSRTARRVPGGGVGALSNREREVAELVAAGLTNRQIAEQLFLSEKTVETHITRILAKLGINSRVAVAASLPHRGSSRSTTLTRRPNA
jgi:ATP/maltotriose-dependent transcriptional regulator MalT